MPVSRSFLDYLHDQFSSIDGIRTRPMMGEQLLYYKDKLAGGIYDDRLLLKPVPAARAAYPDAPMEIPYPGAKPMLMVENLEDMETFAKCLEDMHAQLPAPKKKSAKTAHPKSGSKP